MKSVKGVLLYLCLIVLFSTQLSGSHIIAGYASYSHVVDSTFNIKFTLIRDDQEAANIGWEENINVQIFTYSGNGPDYERTIKITKDFNKPIDHGPYQYLADQKGIDLGYAEYSIDFELTKPTISYLFVFQNCCRSGDIANISNPSKSGLTIFTQIKERARELQNSSFEFDIFPYLIAEVNKEIDHFSPITNLDSDSLAFVWKSIYLGGGEEGSFGGDPTTCEGLFPEGPCYPPYNQILYPGGSFNDPIEGWDDIALDRNTGKLLGIPRAAGKYAYGMSIYEFREGHWINDTNFDYYVHVVLNTSTSELFDDLEQPVLSPNPSSGLINLELNNPRDYEYQVWSTDGRLINIEAVYLENKIQFDLSGKPGLYILKCFNDKLSSSFKVLSL